MSGERAVIRIGLAGWSEAVSRYGANFARHGQVAPDASALGKYATLFDFVEVNASFYRQFRPATYEKWALEVPSGFCFSVKMHRLITHYTRLKNAALLGPFFDSIGGLGDKLGVVLIQLPPSLPFDEAIAASFLRAFREHYDGAAVCEPRHASWADRGASGLLADYRIGLVRTEIPDPRCEEEAGGAPLYLRLHGAPRRYYSAYSDEQLGRLAAYLRLNPQRARLVVFDNTASNAAIANASTLRELVAGFAS